MSSPSTENGYLPSPLAAVRRTSEQGRWVLSFTRELGHPISRVWEAITEPGQLRQWAPFTADRDLAATGPMILTMLDGENGPGELPGSVLRAELPGLLEYTWGADTLRWELTGTDDGTTLTLRQTFDQEEITPALAAGWHICLDVADALMKGVPFGPVVGDRARQFGWDQLNETYTQFLTPRSSSAF